MTSRVYLIANFGGPRTLKEVEPFLNALLTDKEVIRTKLPQPIHNLLFGRIAKSDRKQSCMSMLRWEEDLLSGPIPNM